MTDMENIWLLFVVFAVLTVCTYSVYAFLRRPTEEQINSIKEWLLYAVTEAEKELGSGTGQLKLRYVYNMFVERFPALSAVISFPMLSGLVDEALVQMKKMLESNKALQAYVVGSLYPFVSVTSDTKGGGQQ